MKTPAQKKKEKKEKKERERKEKLEKMKVIDLVLGVVFSRWGNIVKSVSFVLLTP